MSAPAAQQTLFKDLAADLPDQHQAEFFRNLHEAGISLVGIVVAALLRHGGGGWGRVGRRRGDDQDGRRIPPL